MLVLACCVCSQPAYSSLELQEVVSPLSFMLFCTQYPDDCQEQRDRRKTVFRSRGQRWRELNLIISTVNSGIALESLSVSRNDYDWQIFPSAGDLAPKFYPVLSSPRLLDLPGWAVVATGAGAEPSA
ncbi:transglutaminase-like cysteine peptidase [Bradyrhizobium sp. 183]|uniref:transglutaminase-like cysteine peptidase n=1 Tax=unclassified Bradyrhizobium TaxID=2631580 RepID=UPI00204FC77F|nr:MULTISPECIES: transglutaminase-like cysteine peptidase [unclassified Bradyrhizobium]UPJ78932.1 transglutaminase-like cysteine peptidase [Bradyrhizobium sp. 184]UPJ86725.1 transglutaminase-like cysteine peptidase [Bradyrhizobium sp. 183]